MESKEKNEIDEAIGRIFGIKTDVKCTRVLKYRTTGEIIVRLDIKANENQIKKLIPILLNAYTHILEE